MSEPLTKVIGVIPARYSSQRLPKKMLLDVCGKPLIQHTYENAKRCPILDDLYVATDDERIADTVTSFGAKAIKTSTHCLSGTDRIAEAVRIHPKLQQADIIVNVQGDEPCLESEVIEAVVTVLLADTTTVMSTAIVQLTSEEDVTDPHLVKCVIDKDHHALYFSRAIIPGGIYDPHVTYYGHLGIYAYRRDFLRDYSELGATPLQRAEKLEQLKALENGQKIKTALVTSQSIGVDTQEDLLKVKKRLCTQNSSSSQAASVPR